MFKENDFIFYGCAGICKLDAICEQPFEGARTGVSYYVLHTLNEPRQIIYNPTDNDRVLMRHIMTPSEAEEYLRVLSSLSPLEGESARELREGYLTAVKSGLPSEWGRILRTYVTRRRLSEAGLARVTDAEQSFFDQARKLLSEELALVLSISLSEAEARITQALHR